MDNYSVSTYKSSNIDPINANAKAFAEANFIYELIRTIRKKKRFVNNWSMILVIN